MTGRIKAIGERASHAMTEPMIQQPGTPPLQSIYRTRVILIRLRSRHHTCSPFTVPARPCFPAGNFFNGKIDRFCRKNPRLQPLFQRPQPISFFDKAKAQGFGCEVFMRFSHINFCEEKTKRSLGKK
ncbi:MAG: hypothetical protein ACI3VQ_03720 [Faecousia sp.]